MFCTQCGRPFGADDRFCGQCGRPRGQQIPSGSALTGGAMGFVSPPGDEPLVTADRPQALGPLPDWRTSNDYVDIIGHPEVQNLVRDAKGANPGGITAEEFIDAAKPFMKAAGAEAVPLKLVMDIAQPMYAKMGVKTGSETKQGYKSSFGRTLAAVLCSLASRNQRLVGIDQGTDGCVLRAELPSTLTVYKSNMTLTLTRVPEGTLISGAVAVPGQMSDWGHSKRVLADLHQDILNFRSLQT